MDDFNSKHCIPCESDFPPLTLEQAKDFMEHVQGWEMNEVGTEISRTYKFKDFKEALAFANKVGDLAEEEGHHPDLLVSWGKVKITLSTHAIKGLSENDFILGHKINSI